MVTWTPRNIIVTAVLLSALVAGITGLGVSYASTYSPSSADARFLPVRCRSTVQLHSRGAQSRLRLFSKRDHSQQRRHAHDPLLQPDRRSTHLHHGLTLHQRRGSA